MSHCPQCGEPTPEEARACPFCGHMLVELPPGRDGAAGPHAGALVSRTIVGMPGDLGPPRAPANGARAGRPQASTVVLGTPANRAPVPPPAQPPAAQPPAAPPPRAARTLVGVAQPGIAPLAAGAPPAPPPVRSDLPDPPGYVPAAELGATLGALPHRAPPPAADPKRPRPGRVVALDGGEKNKHHRRINLPAPARKALVARPGADEGISPRALAVVLSAGGLALTAVLVALFWPSPPPLTARPRADSTGREGVEVTCKGCPDGTKVSIAGNAAVVQAGAALVPLPTALSVGENRLRVEIDRPGNGRDEAVGVTVHVAYRVRPDLGALQAERPAFQVVAEAAPGTTVSIDGRAVPLAAGRAVESIDVTEVCTGLANDVKTLARQIPFTVTPASGPAEQGVVNVSVGIVPLHLDAPVAIVPVTGAGPEPHVITDGPSFVLAGWTMKGAEVLAAGRPIPVQPDGSFAQKMNVSSVGATQIEVRARMAGMAPRLSSIKVRRVESLEKAARDFASGGAPLGYRELMADLSGAVGKPVALGGEIAETRKQGHQTVMLLDVAASAACPSGACTVRLVQGADNPAKRGDALRIFGHLARAFSVPGRPDIPEIEVDFTLPGEAAKGGK